LAILGSLDSIFPEARRYGEEVLAQKLEMPDANVLLIWDNQEPVGFSLCYRDTSLPKRLAYADAMALRSDYQNRRIGRVFIKAILAILALTRYTGAFLYCESEATEPGKLALTDYYKRYGAYLVDVTEDGARMIFPLRIEDVEGWVGEREAFGVAG
jgi:hypothetical protein